MKINRQRGAAALEFTIILPVFIALALLFFDVSRYFLLQGEMNRTSYSLATMIAHRQQFYLDDQNVQKPLDEVQVTELLSIATELMQVPALGVTVHQVDRVENNDSGYSRFSAGNVCSKKDAAQLRQLYQILDDENEDQEQDLYVVELCQPISGFSLFARFADTADFGQLYASSVMVGR